MFCFAGVCTYFLHIDYPNKVCSLTLNLEILHTQFIQPVMIMIMTKCEAKRRLPRTYQSLTQLSTPPQVWNWMGQARVTFFLSDGPRREAGTYYMAKT